MCHNCHNPDFLGFSKKTGSGDASKVVRQFPFCMRCVRLLRRRRHVGRDTLRGAMSIRAVLDAPVPEYGFDEYIY